MPKLVVTILSGGAGSRLWPLSRDNQPKPFIRLQDGQSLLQKAFLRGAHLTSAVEILTVTNQEFFFQTIDHYEELNHPIQKRFILEPEGRNTAAAIAAAALDIQERYGEDAIMLVLPADHVVTDENAFMNAIDQALLLAEDSQLVAFGIIPTLPNTSYGYIEADNNKVLRFIEKPKLDKAKEYLAQGNFYWNSGMFCFKPGTVISEMEGYCPDILGVIKNTMNQSSREQKLNYPCLCLNEQSFKSVSSNSIDYALLEKSKKVAVVPCSIGWNDVGSWDAFSDLTSPDENNNRSQGEVFFHNTKNSSVIADKKFVALVGVQNIIVVETNDAILVVEKSHTQDAKMVYLKLKELNHDAHKIHTLVHRPWGTYSVLENSEGFKVKRILVKSGAKLSLQSHKNRAEHWVVIKGIAEVTNNEKKITLKENESTYIEKGHRHQLANTSDIPLEIIEVQSGTYLGEDDIERFDDNYGRI